MPINDVYEVRAIWRNLSSGKNNTIGLHLFQAAAADPTPTLIRTKFQTWWTATRSKWAPDIRLDAVSLKRVLPTEGATSDLALVPPLPGTGDADELPASTAVLVSLRTGLPGRARRGRVFLPPSAESGSLGDLTAATAVDIATDFKNLLNDFTSSDLQPVVLSRVDDTTAVITQVRCDQRLRTQRRRQQRQPTYSIAP